MQIAIATTDGLTVNEHFGRASSFLIYNATPKALDFVMKRDVEAYSTGDKSHPFDNDRFQKVATALADCEKVFVSKIGDEPAAALNKLGIEPVAYIGAIKDIKV